MDYHSLKLGEIESSVLRKLWIDAQEDSDGFPASGAFVKYSKYRVDQKINRAYSEMAFASRALRTWFVLPLKANYTQYPVPAGIYDIEVVYLFQSATSYIQLRVEELTYIEDQLTPGWMSYPSVPEYAYVGDKVGIGIKLGVAPAPAQDATAITIGTGGTTGASAIAASGGVYGAAGPSTSGTSFVDSEGQNFTALGVIVGMRLYNISEGVTGTISSVATTVNPSDTIVSDVSWTAGDLMRVLSGEAGSTIEIGDDEATYILTPTAGNVPQPLITMAANNLLVRAWTYPVLLSSQWQYPQITAQYHEAIAYGAASFLAEEEAPDSPEFAQGKVYEQKYGAAIQELRNFVANQYKTAPRMISRPQRWSWR